MFALQYMDYDEGSCKSWKDLQHFDTMEQAREALKRERTKDDEYCLYAYRVTEVGSAKYYSQPTDSLEW